MKKEKSNIPLYIVVFSVNLLSYSAGSTYSWTSPVLPKLASTDLEQNPLGRPITTSEQGWIASTVNLGGAVSCLLCAPVANKYGRKNTILLFSMTMVIGYLLLAFVNIAIVYIVARFILGLGVGCIYSVIPSFISEFSENHNRGFLVGTMVVTVCFGSLVGISVGPFVSVKMLSILNLLPLLLFYPSVVFLVPESPYFLMSINDIVGAEKSLKSVRTYSAESLNIELMDIKEYLQRQNLQKWSTTDLIKTPVLRKALGISCCIILFQQFSGNIAFWTYMESIFQVSKSSLPPYLSVILVATVQAITTIFTSLLSDRLGRKPMLIFSSSGTFVSMLSFGTYSYLQIHGYNIENFDCIPLICLNLYSICYFLGLGSLAYTIIGEIFPSNIKPVAAGLSTFVCFALAFLVSISFPFLNVLFGMAFTYWFFASFCAMSIIFCTVVVPETKGKSFSEIEDILSGKNTKPLKAKTLISQY